MKKLFYILGVCSFLLFLNLQNSIYSAEKNIDDGKINIAVFDYEVTDNSLSHYKGKIAALLTGLLANNADIKIVERKKLDQIMNELELGKTGLTRSDNAAKVGKLAGAHAIIIGKIFGLDDEIIITSNLISIESSVVYSDVVKGTAKTKTSDMVIELAKKIGDTIKREKNNLLVLPETKSDAIAEINEKIKGKDLPSISIAVRERHIGEVTIDPASEIELKYYFSKSGFKLLDSANKELREWVRLYVDDAQTPLLSQLKNIDVIIIGEAFSEFAIRNNNLVVCKARIELQAINTKTTEVIMVDRITETAIDLSTQIAGKTAIQAGTAKIAQRMIPELVEKWQRIKK